MPRLSGGDAEHASPMSEDPPTPELPELDDMRSTVASFAEASIAIRGGDDLARAISAAAQSSGP